MKEELLTCLAVTHLQQFAMIYPSNRTEQIALFWVFFFSFANKNLFLSLSSFRLEWKRQIIWHNKRSNKKQKKKTKKKKRQKSCNIFLNIPNGIKNEYTMALICWWQLYYQSLPFESSQNLYIRSHDRNHDSNEP